MASHHGSPPIKEEKLAQEQVEYVDEIEQVLRQKGFRNSVPGYLLVVYMAILSVFWIAILLVMCLDYYGYVRYDF